MLENYTITFAPAELDLIGAGLGKLPLDAVFSVYAKIKLQVVQQQKEFMDSQPTPAVQPSPELPPSPAAS